MSLDFVDQFSGTNGTAVAGHTPNTGTAWAATSDAGHNYQGPPVSDIRLTGDGFTYNNAAGSSLQLNPTAIANANSEIRFALRCKSVISGSQTAGVTFFTTSAAANDHRYFYSQGFLTLDTTTGTNQFPFSLAANQEILCRVRITEGGGTRNFLCHYSTDAGATWNQSHNLTDTSPTGVLSGTVGLWYDEGGSTVQTATTGYQVGALSVGPTPDVPALSASPATAAAGTPLAITLSRPGALWVAGTPGSPAFTVSGGTGASLSGQVVSGYSAATATLDPGSAAGTLTITDPSGGTATITVSSSSSTVTSVAVSPSAATLAGGDSQAFSAVVAGAGSPGQSVTWSATAGAFSGPIFTAPAATGSIQSITLTATSVQDGTKSGTATVTVPAATASVNATYLSVVYGFPAGLIAGTSAGFGFRVAIGAAPYGPLRTDTVVAEEMPGSYSCLPTAPTGSVLRVKWYYGTAAPVVDGNVQCGVAVPGSTSAVALASGIVVASPTPTAQRFTAVGLPPGLVTGDLFGQPCKFQTGDRATATRRIATHVVAGGNHVITLSDPFGAPPSADDQFIVG